MNNMDENEMFGNSEQLNDTISRAAVLDEIHKYMEERDYTIGTLYDNICEMPSAQSDIIRCPDCYYNDGTAYCELHFRDVKADDFCSWAERRE